MNITLFSSLQQARKEWEKTEVAILKYIKGFERKIENNCSISTKHWDNELKL